MFLIFTKNTGKLFLQWVVELSYRLGMKEEECIQRMKKILLYTWEDLTTPTFDEVTIKLDPEYWGKDKLVIKKEGHGDYIKEIRLGNKKVNKYLISHDDLIKAGEITFVVTDHINK